MNKIGFGGGCHWSMEAIFLSIQGAFKVHQGWIASVENPYVFSEAVVVDYDPGAVSLETLINVHLHTHSCTANHFKREKYHSAVYVYDEVQALRAANAIKDSQLDFAHPVVTQVLRLDEFKFNTQEYLNYYFSDPGKPFCENVITPKLRQLFEQFPQQTNLARLHAVLAGKQTVTFG